MNNIGEDVRVQRVDGHRVSTGVPSYPTLYEISTTMKLERPEKVWGISSKVRRGEPKKSFWRPMVARLIVPIPFPPPSSFVISTGQRRRSG
ncbi:hypothetical protein M0804_014312 [Polistes exclamans]|nr:hypothetical protein M0804_014316 [Polistes exclamans]KAI4475438.1 hypothetical protein M0804_014312 [Polistes exclamans]